MKRNIPSTQISVNTVSADELACEGGRRRIAAVHVLILSGLMIFSSVSAAGANETGNLNGKANRLYSKGKYEEALKLYDDALAIDPSDAKLMMNRGSALYRLGEFGEAERAYLDALSREMGKGTRADAYYNLGNALYRQGERLELEGNAASARGKYSQALENYINTLKLRPNDRDAKWNLQLAHEKVDMLENQEDQQQDQENGGEGQDQRQDGGQGDGDQSDGQNQDGGDQNRDQDQGQGRDQRQEERDMRREEAERLIEQFADDADELSRPQHRGRIRQPEKDW